MDIKQQLREAVESLDKFGIPRNRCHELLLKALEYIELLERWKARPEPAASSGLEMAVRGDTAQIIWIKLDGRQYGPGQIPEVQLAILGELLRRSRGED